MFYCHIYFVQNNLRSFPLTVWLRVFNFWLLQNTTNQLVTTICSCRLLNRMLCATSVVCSAILQCWYQRQHTTTKTVKIEHDQNLYNIADKKIRIVHGWFLNQQRNCFSYFIHIFGTNYIRGKWKLTLNEKHRFSLFDLNIQNEQKTVLSSFLLMLNNFWKWCELCVS